MKIKGKITAITTMTILTLIGISNFSQANGLAGIYQTGKDDAYNAIGGKIIGLVQFICYASAIIILLYKGVGLMNKAPSAKAEAKKELIAYAIGAFILFGIGSIVRIIGTVAMKTV